jgi:hypothetical protein
MIIFFKSNDYEEGDVYGHLSALQNDPLKKPDWFCSYDNLADAMWDIEKHKGNIILTDDYYNIIDEL